MGKLGDEIEDMIEANGRRRYHYVYLNEWMYEELEKEFAPPPMLWEDVYTRGADGVVRRLTPEEKKERRGGIAITKLHFPHGEVTVLVDDNLKDGEVLLTTNNWE